MNVWEELFHDPYVRGNDTGINISKILKFYIKVFYVMGKALSGELSCLWTGFVMLQSGKN